MLIITFGVMALRTNIVFLICFALAAGGLLLFAASFWEIAQGNADTAAHMQVVCALFACLCLPKAE
jgi:hypothetical protein